MPTPLWLDYSKVFVPHHVGLFLDRCLPRCGVVNEDGKSVEPKEAFQLARKKLFRQTVDALAPKQPNAILWQGRQKMVLDALMQPVPGRLVECFEVETVSRMLLHPATNSSVTEGSILLHHTWGVPYLPGSGLKGVARAQARRYPGMEQDVRALFGNDRAKSVGNSPDDLAGLVSFLDAFWVPGDRSPLELDVVTPHHTGYYEGKPSPNPDSADPVPVDRLVVGAGVRFCVVLESVRVAPQDVERLRPWLVRARELLVGGLRDLGFSAWGASGYGRMNGLGGPVEPVEPVEEWVQVKLAWNNSTKCLIGKSGNVSIEVVGKMAAAFFNELKFNQQRDARSLGIGCEVLRRVVGQKVEILDVRLFG